MNIGVLGGTFDPPHIGHLVLAEQAMEQLELDKVIWVPAGDPWRKAEERVSPGADRLAMVRLAVEGREVFEVSIVELEREGPSYTYETLSALQKECPDAGLTFLLGADALRDLPNWREPARIIELAVLGVASRDGDRALNEGSEAKAGLRERVRWFGMPRLDISGTDIRERVATGRSIRYLVPAAVGQYITEHGLYEQH
jgi:nicotinate-nucleotide adenylyltransferase